MRTENISQAFRFGVIGVASNILLYCFYLLLTSFSVGHKVAMTLIFVLGVIQTFSFNKRWTFGHQGFFHVSFMKYVGIYTAAYLFNLIALIVLVDMFELPHEVVQAVMILCIGVILFLLQKFWVFRSASTGVNRL